MNSGRAIVNEAEEIDPLTTHHNITIGVLDIGTWTVKLIPRGSACITALVNRLSGIERGDGGQNEAT